jgi:hypothetical protein
MIKVPETRYAKEMARREKNNKYAILDLFLLICHHWAVGFWYVTNFAPALSFGVHNLIISGTK